MEKKKGGWDGWGGKKQTEDFAMCVHLKLILGSSVASLVKSNVLFSVLCVLGYSSPYIEQMMCRDDACHFIPLLMVLLFQVCLLICMLCMCAFVHVWAEREEKNVWR